MKYKKIFTFEIVPPIFYFFFFNFDFEIFLFKMRESLHLFFQVGRNNKKKSYLWPFFFLIFFFFHFSIFINLFFFIFTNFFERKTKRIVKGSKNDVRKVVVLNVHDTNANTIIKLVVRVLNDAQKRDERNKPVFVSKQTKSDPMVKKQLKSLKRNEILKTFLNTIFNFHPDALRVMVLGVLRVLATIMKTIHFFKEVLLSVEINEKIVF